MVNFPSKASVRPYPGPPKPRALLAPSQGRHAPHQSLAIGRSYALGGTLGRIYIEELLGTGPHSRTYGVRSAQIPGPLALKVVDLRHGNRERFSLAAALQRRCAGPHILAPIAVATRNTLGLLLTQRAEGGELETWLCRSGSGAATLAMRLRHATAMAQAVAACHARNVIHRDIKPENFLFVDAKQRSLKLIDFEMACEHPSAQSVGTVTYMAPEALAGASVAAPADVWALGVSLFRIVVGIEPHYADDEAEVAARVLHDNPSTSLDDLRLTLKMARFDRIEQLVALVAQALRVNPNLRPRAEEFAQRLESLLAA